MVVRVDLLRGNEYLFYVLGDLGDIGKLALQLNLLHQLFGINSPFFQGLFKYRIDILQLLVVHHMLNIDQREIGLDTA